MIKIFALNNNYSYNIVILIVFNYLHSVSTSLSSNEMASNCDIDRVTHAIIQQRIRLALASAIYVHYFLPMRPVYTSSRTGNRYTEEILRAHPRRVIDLIRHVCQLQHCWIYVIGQLTELFLNRHGLYQLRNS